MLLLFPLSDAPALRSGIPRAWARGLVPRRPPIRSCPNAARTFKAQAVNGLGLIPTALNLTLHDTHPFSGPFPRATFLMQTMFPERKRSMNWRLTAVPRSNRQGHFDKACIFLLMGRQPALAPIPVGRDSFPSRFWPTGVAGLLAS